jgi:hypothetical protein
LFFAKAIKVSTDLIFNNNKQILVVKSWQKILYKDPELGKVKRNKSSASFISPRSRMKACGDDVSEKSAFQEIPSGFENEKCFFIKTIQFYNEYGKAFCQPILTE